MVDKKVKKRINKLFVISFAFYILFLLWNIIFNYVPATELLRKGRYFSESINSVHFNDIIMDFILVFLIGQ